MVAAYERLGIGLECTCTPYYLRETSYGDHLAWSESSAVSYANSVIGARTNREGGPGALAAALVGKTPCYGFHLGREPETAGGHRVQADTRDWSIAHYGALGYHAGKLVGNRIPFFSRHRAGQGPAQGARGRDGGNRGRGAVPCGRRDARKR